jgi:hypothetical protein
MIFFKLEVCIVCENYNVIFWDMTRCSVDGYRLFKGFYCYPEDGASRLIGQNYTARHISEVLSEHDEYVKFHQLQRLGPYN